VFTVETAVGQGKKSRSSLLLLHCTSAAFRTVFHKSGCLMAMRCHISNIEVPSMVGQASRLSKSDRQDACPTGHRMSPV